MFCRSVLILCLWLCHGKPEISVEINQKTGAVCVNQGDNFGQK